MRTASHLVPIKKIHRRAIGGAQALGLTVLLMLLQACGSGSTSLVEAPATGTSNAPTITSTSTPSTTGTGTPTTTTTTTTTGTSTPTTGTGTSSSSGGGPTPSTPTTTGTGTGTTPTTPVVTPSYVSDPVAAVQRIHSTTNLLWGFEKFFADPFGSQVPTVNKDGDFQYFDCTGQRFCAGSVSLTRTFTTAGTTSVITAGTAYAWYFQNYNRNGAMAIPTITLNGTAYLAFPEGFTAEIVNFQKVYNGKATLYIKTTPPQDVIDFEGSIKATNLSSEGIAPYTTVGKLEITPNNLPTWTIDFNNWRSYQGSGIEASKLSITESGQTAELSIELASFTETIYVLTYRLNDKTETVRIRKTWVSGGLQFVRI